MPLYQTPPLWDVITVPCPVSHVGNITGRGWGGRGGGYDANGETGCQGFGRLWPVDLDAGVTVLVYLNVKSGPHTPPPPPECY